MKPITAPQLKAINFLLIKQGLYEHKRDIIESYTGGRTGSSKEMYIHEAAELLSYLNNTQKDVNVSSKLMAKLFAMCHEMGWIPSKTIVEGASVKVKKDYTAVHEWVKKYGYLKKELRLYTYNELPKLVTQLEKYVYNPYIENLSKTNQHEKINSTSGPAPDSSAQPGTNESPFL